MEGAFKGAMKSTLFLILVICMNVSYGQDNFSFCKAVQKENFRKVERILKRMIKEIPESRDYTDTLIFEPRMDENIESLTQWFKGFPCVEDAFQDKCQNKILIYPGWSVIGVKFRTGLGIVEKCFSIQLGTTGTTNLFGWRPKTGRMKNKLVYKRMFDCPGFIMEQKKNCLIK